MCQNIKNYNYYEDNVNQILEMDYYDNNFCMGFILPKNSNNISLINNEQLQYYITQMKNKEINLIKIPRFKQETRYKIDNLFKKYGMKEIFSNADLSEIIPSFNFPIFITDIIHNTLIVVEEYGVKVSSVSTIIQSFGHSNQITNFIANHPFLYYIRFKPENIILFVGQYY